MSNRDFDEAAGIARANRPSYTDIRIKVTGWLDPVTGVVEDDPTARAIAGNMYVHGYPRGGNVQVLVGSLVNPYVANARVKVGQNEAGQAVAFEPVVDRNSVNQWGTGLTGLAQPINVPTMGLLEGRLQASELGGLYVHVNAFYYEGGYWQGGTVIAANTLDPTTYDFDVAADVPVTDGFSVWVRVYFDPVTAALHSVAGTPTYTGNNPWLLLETDIPSILIPAGVYPTGAVALSYGQVDFSPGRFASVRLLISPDGVTQTDWNRIVVDADGAVVTDADGYVVIDNGA